MEHFSHRLAVSPDEPSAQDGKAESPAALPMVQRGAAPFDREAGLAELLLRIQRDGAEPHEPAIDEIRSMIGLSAAERQIVMEIFRLGFEAAERKKREDKMWVYQRLLRRLLLFQPLDESIPLAERCPEARQGEAAGVTAPSSEMPPSSTQRSGLEPEIKKTANRRLVACALYALGVVVVLSWAIAPPRTPSSGQNQASVAAEYQQIAPDKPTTSEGFAEPAELIPTVENTAQPAPAAADNSPVEEGAAAISEENFPNPAQTSPPLLRTVRHILLREEPRFGAPSQIMLDIGARLLVLEIDGKWIKVKMEQTGAVGFVRKEFVVPIDSSRRNGP